MTLLAHKILLYPTKDQEEYFKQACGAKRHCYNHLLGFFSQEKYSKKRASEVYKELRKEFPWYSEVSQRATRNSVDDLDNAFKSFFRNCKSPKSKKKGFPKFKKKGDRDSFALREVEKFDVNGRHLRIEKLKSKIQLSQEVRWEGVAKQVTISCSGGKWYASILVDATNYVKKAGEGIVGVDLGIKSFVHTSKDEIFPANQKLKDNMKRLRRLQRNLSKKKKGSNRGAKAKLRLARLHRRIANQRKAVTHEITDFLTKSYKVIVIEDLNIKGMLKNRKLSRAIQDCGFYMFRSQLDYKAKLRGNVVITADRWFASSKICSRCKHKKDDLKLSDRVFHCEHCGLEINRDLNAAINLEEYGEDTFKPTITKRTQESCKTFISNGSKDVDGVNNRYRTVMFGSL